jgi:hypothetical protein
MPRAPRIMKISSQGLEAMGYGQKANKFLDFIFSIAYSPCPCGRAGAGAYSLIFYFPSVTLLPSVILKFPLFSGPGEPGPNQ